MDNIEVLLFLHNSILVLWLNSDLLSKQKKLWLDIITSQMGGLKPE